MRISDWSSDVCSSDLSHPPPQAGEGRSCRAGSASKTGRRSVGCRASDASVFGAEPADKPGPVLDSHSSRRSVTATLKQPTRTRRGQRHGPYLALLPVGFAVPACCQARGAPLPHHFPLATRPEGPFGGLLSVALSVGSRRPGVTWHRALWSPDFPRHPFG